MAYSGAELPFTGARGNRAAANGEPGAVGLGSLYWSSARAHSAILRRRFFWAVRPASISACWEQWELQIILAVAAAIVYATVG